MFSDRKSKASTSSSSSSSEPSHSQRHLITKLMTSASVAKPANAATAESQHSTPDKQSEANKDWLLCARWLNECRCLPAPVQQRLVTNELTLSEFANALRDGEILCILANYLIPGSVDVTQINKRAHNSQMLCLKNIRLFLDACISPAFFNLNESDLFDEHMVNWFLFYFSLIVYFNDVSVGFIWSRCYFKRVKVLKKKSII